MTQNDSEWLWMTMNDYEWLKDFGYKMGFGPWGWALDLKTGILASRLVYGLQGWDMGLEVGRGTEREKEEKE